MDAFAHEMTFCAIVSCGILAAHSRHKEGTGKLASVSPSQEPGTTLGFHLVRLLEISPAGPSSILDTWGNWAQRSSVICPRFLQLTWALHCLRRGLPYSAPCMLPLLLGRLTKGLSTKGFLFCLQQQLSWRGKQLIKVEFVLVETGKSTSGEPQAQPLTGWARQACQGMATWSLSSLPGPPLYLPALSHCLLLPDLTAPSMGAGKQATRREMAFVI